MSYTTCSEVVHKPWRPWKMMKDVKQQNGVSGSYFLKVSLWKICVEMKRLMVHLWKQNGKNRSGERKMVTKDYGVCYGTIYYGLVMSPLRNHNHKLVLKHVWELNVCCLEGLKSSKSKLNLKCP